MWKGGNKIELPKSKKEQRTGVSGANLISSRIAKIATVNPYTDDLGLDFFCDTLYEDLPGFTFFVQAKGTENFSDSWSEPIKTKTIRYWLERPGPVYLFVADTVKERTYWISIEDKRRELNAKLNESSQKTISFRPDISDELNTENKEKFKNKLQSDFVLFYTNKGTPPVLGDGYIKHIPSSDFSQEQRQTIFNSIRFSLYHLILDSIRKKEFPEAIRLIEGLIKLGSAHALNYLLLAQSLEDLDELDDSLLNYETTLKIINEDPIFLGHEAGQMQKALVERKIKEVSEKIKLAKKKE